MKEDPTTQHDFESLGEALSAYIDGELDAAQTRRVEQRLTEDESARKLVEELRRNAAGVSSLPRHTAPNSIAVDVQRVLERSALLDDLPVIGPRVHRERSPRSVRWAMAAVLGLVVISGWWVISDLERPGATQQLASRVMEEKAAAPKAKSATTAPSVGNEADKSDAVTLAAAATFEQKILEGATEAALRAHAFASEPVRMQLAVGSDVQRDAVASQIVSRLVSEQVVELGRAAPHAAGERPAAQAVFIKGRAGANFAESGATQLLVRAKPRQIASVLREVQSAGLSDERVTLAVGTLSTRGLTRAQVFFDPPPSRQVRQDAPAGKSAGGEAKDRDWLVGLLQVINVDPEMVNAKDAESDSEPPAKPGAPGAVLATRTRALNMAKTMGEKKEAASPAELEADAPYVTLVIEVIPPKSEPRGHRSATETPPANSSGSPKGKR